MPDPIDAELDALEQITAAKLDQLFHHLERLNLQPHEHALVVEAVTDRLSTADPELGELIEDTWVDHPGWGRGGRPKTTTDSEIFLLTEGGYQFLLQEGSTNYLGLTEGTAPNVIFLLTEGGDPLLLLTGGTDYLLLTEA